MSSFYRSRSILSATNTCRSFGVGASAGTTGSQMTRRAYSASSSRSLPFRLPPILQFGLASSLLSVALLWQLPSGKIHLDAPTGEEIVPRESGFQLDPATKQPLPTKLPKPAASLPPTCGDLVLVGLGVRTVSFLSIRVYVAGLYVDSKALKRIQEIKGWKGFQKQWLLDEKSGPSGEELVANLIDQGVPCVIRIVPVRSTDFAHLRDGFTRSIQARAKLARKANAISPSSDEALSYSLQALKDAFPKASLPKGSSLDLVFAPKSSVSSYLPGTSSVPLTLTLEQDGKILGKIDPPSGSEENRFSVARQLMLAYLADKDEISKPFKQSVAEGLEAVVSCY